MLNLNKSEQRFIQLILNKLLSRTTNFVEKYKVGP